MLTLIVYIAILGLIVWAITTLIPMPDAFRKVIYVLAAVVVLLLLLKALGAIGNVALSVPELR